MPDATSVALDLPPPSARAPEALRPPGRLEWGLLGIMVVAGGSSFSGIRIAVETAPPSLVAAGRLWVAAAVLLVFMLAARQRPMPLIAAGRLNPAWLFAFAIGVFGYSVPMILFPIAQKTVPSLLAGIYMAFMPLVTVFLAAAFAAERLTVRKLTGFLIGLAGVLALIGPSALSGMATASLTAQGLLLLATAGYAIASVLTRRAPPIPRESLAFAFMLCGAVQATPLALADAAALGGISLRSWLGIIYLGVVNTGITAIMIVAIIRAAGASFMAIANYLTPVVAIAFGVVLWGEPLKPSYMIGLLIILLGVSIAQPGPLEAVRDIWRGFRAGGRRPRETSPRRRAG